MVLLVRTNLLLWVYKYKLVSLKARLALTRHLKDFILPSWRFCADVWKYTTMRLLIFMKRALSYQQLKTEVSVLIIIFLHFLDRTLTSSSFYTIVYACCNFIFPGYSWSLGSVMSSCQTSCIICVFSGLRKGGSWTWKNGTRLCGYFKHQESKPGLDWCLFQPYCM